MSKRKQVTVPMEKIKEQDKYINEIKNENERYFHLTGKKKSYFIQTFGCQMNEHDSEKLGAMLNAMGYEPSLMADNADLIIYNTCAVRENAELKVYGNLGACRVKGADRGVQFSGRPVSRQNSAAASGTR